MVGTLQRVHSRAANPREFTAGELDERTLERSDDWYELFGAQADNTTTYGGGFGQNDERTNSDGWSDMDLQDDAGNAIKGRIRFRVYRDSNKDDLVAQSGTYTLNSLRSAVEAGRKDKSLIPGMLSVVPRTDGFLTVEVQPAPESEGATVSRANSNTDQGIAYSEMPF